ncbi:MAG: hypothetical protein KCHDKBKB_01298 [Elusimicrobia bacterium]|nr:hypothetical protein [Elusimicrobiota bacterium]
MSEERSWVQWYLYVAGAFWLVGCLGGLFLPVKILGLLGDKPPDPEGFKIMNRVLEAMVKFIVAATWLIPARKVVNTPFFQVVLFFAILIPIVFLYYLIQALSAGNEPAGLSSFLIVFIVPSFITFTPAGLSIWLLLKERRLSSQSPQSLGHNVNH